MERLTGKDAKLMMEALAAVYEKKYEKEGDCIDKDKKTKHNCAKKVCSEQWGEGTCVPEHHTLLEDGTVTHYDVVFEHGLERMVPIQELEVLVTEMHEHASMEGGHIDEGIADDPRFGVVGQAARLGQKMFGNASQRNSAVSYERSVNDLTKSRGGGNVAQGADGKPITAAQIAAQTKKRRLADPKYKPGQGVDSGAKPGSGGKPTGGGGGNPPPPPKPPTAQERAYGSRSTLNKDQQSVNKRYDELRKSDPEAAAAYGKKMAAAGAAKKDFSIPKPTQAQSNPTAAQKQASVNAAVKSANRPENLNKQAPAGSALRRQQDKQAAGKPSGTAAGSMKSGAAAGGSAGRMGAAVGRLTSKPTSISSGQSVGKTKEMMDKGKKAIFKKEDLDVFDIIKGHLIDEGLTEEEALNKMLTLTDDERSQIIEGPALQNTIRTLETRRDKMDKKSPGSSNQSAGGGSQSVGGALYKAYGRLKGV